jgi:phage baseplate assembly protein gpV
MSNNSIVEMIRKIANMEIQKLHTLDLGIITSVFPHSLDDDKNNFECNVKLKDKEVELRKVPVATSHIGLSNIVHSGDLVLVSYINGDFNSPVVIGRLYNDEDRPPLSKEEEIVYQPSYSQDNSLRRLNIVLPQGTVNIDLYDDRLNVKIGKTSFSAQSKGEIEIKSEKTLIILDDTQGIKIKSDINLQIESTQDLSIKASNINIDGTVNTTLKGGVLNVDAHQSSNIQSVGPMTIKGAIVNINP